MTELIAIVMGLMTTTKIDGYADEYAEVSSLEEVIAMTKTTRFYGNRRIGDGVDSNCDGADDYGQDGDGYPIDGNDCNDEDNTIYAGAEDAV